MTSANLKQIDSELQSHYKFLCGLPIGDKRTAPVQYPSSPDPSFIDKNFYAKAYGATPQTVLPITDGDVQALRDKEFQYKNYQFDQWVGENLHPGSSPVNMEFLRKLYPEWEDRQVQAIEDWHNFKAKLEKLKVTGATNKEELWWCWQLGLKPSGAADSGITPPNVSVAERYGDSSPALQQITAADPAKRQGDFMRGLLNPRRTTEVSQFAQQYAQFTGNADLAAKLGGKLGKL